VLTLFTPLRLSGRLVVIGDGLKVEGRQENARGEEAASKLGE
jgi:hypothetical protein